MESSFSLFHSLQASRPFITFSINTDRILVDKYTTPPPPSSQRGKGGCGNSTRTPIKPNTYVTDDEFDYGFQFDEIRFMTILFGYEMVKGKNKLINYTQRQVMT